MKTLTGGWVPAANGTLELALDQQYFVGGSSRNAPRRYRYPLGPEGEIPADHRVWGNDELMPVGSRYRVTIFNPYDYILFGPQDFTICGDSPIDMTTLIQFCAQASVGPGPGTGFSTFALTLDNMFGQPSPGQVVLLYTAFSQQVYPPNFTSPSSYGSVGVPPSTTVHYTVFLNTVQVGTIQIDHNGSFTFLSSGFTVNPGDRLTITAPDPADWTLSDVAISLVSTRLT
jgi:hypothetical protein